ncbi:unnamed protein product [Caenorhabditis bovis]|uniref:C6 domain-containing protein n=1 Tax=Caenorhabditis bovis TaxID=2654633 RepID=A0A8S1FB20_9PELO|nr:unnamed protein product [Caenorhabditis bovis]
MGRASTFAFSPGRQRIRVMLSTALLFISAIGMSQACMSTSVITTTAPVCCKMLSQETLARRTPSNSAYEQCSILRRVSSSCPEDGIVVCDAADDTNPRSIHIEFFNNDNVVRTATKDGNPVTTLTAKVVCINGEWRVPLSTNSETTERITSVSCSQTGSQGADKGYIMNTAI